MEIVKIRSINWYVFKNRDVRTGTSTPAAIPPVVSIENDFPGT